MWFHVDLDRRLTRWLNFQLPTIPRGWIILGLAVAAWLLFVAAGFVLWQLFA